MLLLWLLPPVWRSQIEAHEIHRGKEREVRMSLALSTIQVTVRISSVKFLEGSIDGDTTYLHLHSFGMELKRRYNSFDTFAEYFHCISKDAVKVYTDGSRSEDRTSNDIRTPILRLQ
ncbi:hypothetical protein TNCV_5071 [Trichonephila clavipes]|nr:hypothetical protein TNCV_5071 [Trichonephila clavipes]